MTCFRTAGLPQVCALAEASFPVKQEGKARKKIVTQWVSHVVKLICFRHWFLSCEGWPMCGLACRLMPWLGAIMNAWCDMCYFQLVICPWLAKLPSKSTKAFLLPWATASWHSLLITSEAAVITSLDDQSISWWLFVSLEAGQLWLVPAACLWGKLRDIGPWPGSQVGCALQSRFGRHDDLEVL